MRVGVFGGSFDPVHNGHLRVAEACQSRVPLDVVLFVPAAQQPLKPEGPVASPQDRLRMLELALQERVQGAEPTAFAISKVEIERGGVSYTVDTLRQLAADRPADELYLLLGADTLGDLANWREPRAICELATLAVVGRPGAGESVEPPPGCRLTRVPMDPLDVSSSDIRRRRSQGQSIAGLVPDAVAKFIADRELYRR